MATDPKIKIPNKCLKSNPGFSKIQQISIIRAMLLEINLPVQRSSLLRLKIKGFGTISTHGNRRDLMRVSQTRYNKKRWKRKKQLDEFSIKKLLQ